MANKIPQSKIGSLGQLPFICSSNKVQTFSGLSRTNNARWATHEIIGQKPVLEFVGLGLSTVELTMRFDLSLGSPPEKMLNRLKRMVENRQYKTLIIGGECLGRYIIESINEERKYHTGNGVCLVAEAKINLTEWAG